jgi:hypothetical protein
MMRHLGHCSSDGQRARGRLVRFASVTFLTERSLAECPAPPAESTHGQI